MMDVDIITIFPGMFQGFPGMFQGFLQEGLVARAQKAGVVRVGVHELRDYTQDRHRSVDDYPYGGGAGMVFRPEPLFAAVEALRRPESWVVLLDPQGQTFSQAVAQELSARPHLILLCGRYEGVDERVRDHLVDQEVSLGDFLLAGGEVAALAIVEAVVRLLPGALGSPQSLEEESHSSGLLEYPQYTRPPVFRGWAVPPILLSGNHQEIARWRREQALLRTRQRRPELLGRADLTPQDRRFLEKIELGEK